MNLLLHLGGEILQLLLLHRVLTFLIVAVMVNQLVNLLWEKRLQAFSSFQGVTTDEWRVQSFHCIPAGDIMQVWALHLLVALIGFFLTQDCCVKHFRGLKTVYCVKKRKENVNQNYCCLVRLHINVFYVLAFRLQLQRVVQKYRHAF